MARNGRLIVLANEEDDEMVDIVAGGCTRDQPLGHCGSWVHLQRALL